MAATEPKFYIAFGVMKGGGKEYTGHDLFYENLRHVTMGLIPSLYESIEIHEINLVGRVEPTKVILTTTLEREKDALTGKIVEQYAETFAEKGKLEVATIDFTNEKDERPKLEIYDDPVLIEVNIPIEIPLGPEDQLFSLGTKSKKANNDYKSLIVYSSISFSIGLAVQYIVSNFII